MQTETKQTHTPGPWRVGNGNVVVCDSREGTHYGNGNEEYYGGCLVAESIKSEANARLIAAAPDLLEALESAVHALEANAEHLGSYHVGQLEKARAAISKAKGEA